MLDKIGETGLVTVGRVIDGMRSGSANSYVDYTRPLRVEPRLIVDSSLMFYEHTPTVTQSLHSAFSAYYLLSWNMLMATIDNIAVARHLDKLNPNRSVKDSVVDSAGAIWNISSESYAHKLPSFGLKPSNEANGGRQGNVVNTGDYVRESVAKGVKDALDENGRKSAPLLAQAMQEAEDRQKQVIGNAVSGLKNDLKRDRKNELSEQNLMVPGGLASRSLEVIKEASNLSVGKILEVQISNSGKSSTLPVMIRLHASVMVPNLLADLLATGNVDNGFGARKIKYDSGQISFLDLLTARDLNKRHKKNLMQDKTGVYTAVADQKRNNSLAGFLSLNPSVANATNLVVTTTETIKKLELEIGGRFDDFKIRQRLFNTTGIFIVAVIDQEYDRVKFYTTDIPDSSNLSMRDCAASNKKEGASITDILKAYQLGNAPGF